MGTLKRLFLLIVLLGIQACGSFQAMPPQAVIERGLALRMVQTQRQLVEQLAPQSLMLPNFTLSHVDVSQRQAEADGVYHVCGSYDMVTQMTSRQVKTAGDFDIRLQAQHTDDTVSWYLLLDGEQTLVTTEPV